MHAAALIEAIEMSIALLIEEKNIRSNYGWLDGVLTREKELAEDRGQALKAVEENLTALIDARIKKAFAEFFGGDAPNIMRSHIKRL